MNKSAKKNVFIFATTITMLLVLAFVFTFLRTGSIVLSFLYAMTPFFSFLLSIPLMDFMSFLADKIFGD